MDITIEVNKMIRSYVLMRKLVLPAFAFTLLGFFLSTVSFVGKASAASLISDDTPLNNCTTLNCNAVILSGHSERNSFGDSIPFTAEIWAAANECLRLDVTYQASNTLTQRADMKIVLVSPSGSMWRNDDRAPGDLHSLVTARADVQGHYTVQVNYYNGNQLIPSYQNFGLAYGRYVPGTPNNCPNPAVATSAAAITK